MKKIEEMTTLELFQAMMNSLIADKDRATALRTCATSGTGQQVYSDRVRIAAKEAHKRFIAAREELSKAYETISAAVAAHNVAQKIASEELANA
jgi:hypothetical protein